MYCIARNTGAELNLADSGFNENTTELITGNYVSSANVSYTDTLTEGGGEWQYVYSTRTATVTVSYTDTLTEGGGGRGESGSTCTVHVLPQLLYLTRIL